LSKDAKTSQVNEAHVSQPACTAVQLSLTDLFRSWGIWPTAVAGHSSGEIGAAYAAGILPFDACMAISYFRGTAVVELKRKFPDLKGAMMAVGGSQEEIAPLIAQLKAKEVRIACFNSPSSLTISGDEPAIDELQALIEEKQLFNRKLQVDVAYHSHHMKLVAKEYHDSLKSLDPPKPTYVKFHSSLLGHVIESSKLDASYWVDNLTKAVRFSEALTSMVAPANGFKTGVNVIVEIGPHSALAGPVKQILKAAGPNAMKIPYASALIRKKDAVETALELAGTLFTKGASLNFGALNFPKPGKPPALLVDMPRYPWNHQTKYWHEPRQQLKLKNRTTPRNDILGTVATYSNDLEPTWRNIIAIDDLPWLRHHKIQSLVLFPMAGFISMALEAASQRAATRGVEFDKYELRDISVTTPLMLAEENVEMTLQLRAHQEGTLVSSETWDEFRIHSWTKGKGWTEHCKGLVTVKSNDSSVRAVHDSEVLLQSAISEICSAGVSSVDKAKMYDSLAELGVSYGPTFQGMNNCQASETSSMATITVKDTASEMPLGYQTSTILHPAFLEQLIEMYWPILGAGRTSVDTVYLPSSIGRLTVSSDITEVAKKPGNSLRAFCKGVAAPLHPKPVQVSMFATAVGDSKQALITLEDLTIAPIIERDIDSGTGAFRELCYKMDWESALQPLDSVLTNGTATKINGYVNGVSLESPEDSDGASPAESNGVSTPISEQSCEFTDYPDGDIVIIHGDSESQKQLASKLADTIELSTEKRPVLSSLADANTEDKLTIFIPELDKPLLSTLTSEEFSALQKVIVGVQGVLWVVRGAYTASNNPDANMVTGLSRSIRSETLLKFATLDLDPNSKLTEDQTTEAILRVFKATFGPKSGANCELEFAERNGSFFTPRIINDEEMNEYVHKQIKASFLEPTPFFQDDRAMKMVIGTPGAFDTLHFVDDESVEAPLPEDEIEIEVKAIGVNSIDLEVVLGHLETQNLGVEASGIVTKVGSGVDSFAVGDRVAAITVSSGVFSNFTRAKAGHSLKIGSEVSFEAAASIPIAYTTAQYGLLDLGRLIREESVLIHGATTPVGQAAISLAQAIGANIFVTAANGEEKETLTKSYGIQDDHIFSSSGASFKPAILQATQKRGVDVVLSCIITDADTTRETWGSLGNFGRFIVVGKPDGNARLETSRFENNTSLFSVDLLSVATQRPKILSRLVSEVSSLLESGKIGPSSSITVFPISDVETAFKVLQSGTASGKLIVVPQPEDQVKVCVSRCLLFYSNR
jgi:NADPH:quinone reductase-like Zn-dependent oxidoreductase/malonyl CoA-acyl carrier protein transacylase